MPDANTSWPPKSSFGACECVNKEKGVASRERGGKLQEQSQARGNMNDGSSSTSAKGFR